MAKFETRNTPTKNITVPSEASLGVQLTLGHGSSEFGFESGLFGLFGFFGLFGVDPASRSPTYPRVLRVEPTSAAHAAGLRAGHELVALNGHSLGGRDADTVRSDFAYEKRRGPTLSLEFR